MQLFIKQACIEDPATSKAGRHMQAALAHHQQEGDSGDGENEAEVERLQGGRARHQLDLPAPCLLNDTRGSLHLRRGAHAACSHIIGEELHLRRDARICAGAVSVPHQEHIREPALTSDT